MWTLSCDAKWPAINALVNTTLILKRLRGIVYMYVHVWYFEIFCKISTGKVTYLTWDSMFTGMSCYILQKKKKKLPHPTQGVWIVPKNPGVAACNVDVLTSGHEPFPTVFTFVWPLTSVYQDVWFEMRVLCKCLPAYLQNESNMAFKFAYCGQRKLAFSHWAIATSLKMSTTDL